MLDKEFIEELKQELLKQKVQIESDLQLVAVKDDGHYKPKFPNIGDEEDDSQLEVSEYDEKIDAEKRLSKLLEETNSALKRIDDGTYGFCKECNKEIDPSRLRAYPQASTCVECS